MIAAVEGIAVGVGATLLLHCDLVYATADATFRTPFLDLGLVPEAGSSMLAPMRMGHARAFELLALGETFDARKALQAGLINAIVPAGELEATAHGAAMKLAAKQVSNRDGMALKSTDDLKKLYAKLDPSKETIVYCQSGVRASETAAVLRDLGFKDVKVHEPSWLGYASNLSAPAEDEVFVNIGALNGRIASLQNRVQELEGEVVKLKPAK